MNVLSEIYKHYGEHGKKEERLEKLILKHQRTLKKLQDKGGWINLCLVPLANKISERLHMPYEIYGPFGLGAETSIYFYPNGKVESLMKAETYGITIHPACRDGEGSFADRFYFSYNTGEKRNLYAQGTIGEMNGFNNVEAPLPDDLDVIVEIILKNHHVPSNEKEEK